MRNVSLTVLFLISIAFSQNVSISGKVTATGGAAIEGAVVKLFVNAMACTSKADGSYSLGGLVSTIGTATLQQENGVSFRNKAFVFRVSAPVSAQVRLYDLSGRKVATVFSGNLRQGSTSVPFAFGGLSHEMYLVRVAIGETNETYTMVSTSDKNFTLAPTLATRNMLAKAEAVPDWLQASKAGYASSSQQISTLTGVVNITLGALAAPNFGANVKIFDPTMSASTIQSGMNFSTGESSTNRVAWFFKPGNYSVTISVNFYIQAYGLGMSPEDVKITGSVQDVTGEGTGSFWRGAEGFSFTPAGGTDVWGVSQADPFRRNHVKGALNLCTNGASGGFISDCVIDGQISTNCEQQFYLRNSNINGCNSGGIWNMLFQGCNTPPAETYPTGGVTVSPKTPLVREKPYIVFDNTSGTYSVFVPALRTNSQGTTWYNATPAGELLPIDQFYIAQSSTDNATTINAALAQGKNLILTPGIYQVSAPILVQRPNTVVLGLGMATLQPQNGVIPLRTADADGITIANLLIQAGTMDSPALFQVGDSGSVQDHTANPPFVFDLFIRAGGAVAGTAKIGAIFNSNNTVLDHCWIWRADHGAGSGWITDTNTVRNGLVVNGNNCITYGQMVEHWQKYNTVWNGNNGQQYFYQNEYSYAVPNQASFMEGTKPGMPAIKVTDGVTKFLGWCLGVYSNFRGGAITVTNAVEIPKVPGASVHHVVTFSLDGDMGTILHAVNDTGPAAKYGATHMIRFGDYVGH